ncbi:hypothetical protein BC834DRAFT_308966 [Gloeopeniophorella convolvens]|nr:hypothetical protein BC834DRAFT_308966 [Gloeopeniophorella convolvens]
MCWLTTSATERPTRPPPPLRPHFGRVLACVCACTPTKLRCTTRAVGFRMECHLSQPHGVHSTPSAFRSSETTRSSPKALVDHRQSLGTVCLSRRKFSIRNTPYYIRGATYDPYPATVIHQSLTDAGASAGVEVPVESRAWWSETSEAPSSTVTSVKRIAGGPHASPSVMSTTT